MNELAAILLVLAFAALVRSAVGFGDALLSMGLLAPLLGLATATPLVGLTGTAISVIILAQEWRGMQLRHTLSLALPLILSTLAGIPFGLLLITVVPAWVGSLVLGVLLLAYGLYGLFGLPLPNLPESRLSWVFGAVAGVLGGAYNTNGPPIVIWGTLRRWSPAQLRLILQGYFFWTNLLILAGHALGGLWTAPVWRMFAFSLPGIALATWLGGRVHKRLPQALFHRLVFALLALVGAVFLMGL